MQYGNLDCLWLLSLVPLLALGYVLAFRWKRKALARFASVELHEKILQGVSKRKQRFKAALVVLAVAFLVFALVEPKWGYHWEEVHRRGIDIVIALDVSRSMLADDVKPNRLEAAKREIKDLLSTVRGDRIGLVAFAGTAFIQCPLTLDYGAFRLFLDDLGPATIPVGGTAIGEAILKSCQAFESKLKKHKAIILITDGEDHEGNPLEAAKEAKKQGVVIFPIGAGTREGCYIWVEDERGNRVRLKARDGEIVKSHLDEMTLNKIALETGGRYSRADSKDWPLERIYAERIAAMEERELGSERIRRYENRYQVPLAIALALLIIEALMSERARKAAQPLLVFLLATLLLGWADPLADKTREANRLYEQKKYDDALAKYADAQTHAPESAQLYFNIGGAHYRKGKLDEAIQSFQKALETRDVVLEAKAHYNIGNCQFRQGKLTEALDSYKRAIELTDDPKGELGPEAAKVRDDAKFNHEFVEKKIKEMLDQQKQREQEQQKQQDKQDKQEQQQDQKGDQQEKPEQQDKKDEQKKQDSSQPEKKEQEPKQEEQPQPSQAEPKDKREMSQEEAERLLSALKEDEDKLRKMRKEQQMRGERQVEKDW